MISIAKILHICLGNYYADDFGYQENLITKYQKRDGFEVTILASRVNYCSKDASMYLDEPREYINRDGISIKRIDYRFAVGRLLRKMSRVLKVYKGTYQHIQNECPDIIFLHGTQFWDVEQVIVYKNKHPEVKIYADNHADFINSAKNLLSRNILHGIIWRHRIKRLEPHCEKFWGVTPNRCDFLRDVYGVSSEKIELLPMGADTDKIDFRNKEQIRKDIRNTFQFEDDDFVIVSGGKIDERKNIHRLIQAVNDLGEPKVKLLLIGVPDRKMTPIIESLSNSEYVRMAGWVSPESVYDYFLASDLGFFPGTHSVLWEQAVGCGLPCVFRKWPGMTHVDVGGNCVFVSDGTIETITETIQLICGDANKYQRMKDMAIAKGMTSFSYEEISRKSIGYLEGFNA